MAVLPQGTRLEVNDPHVLLVVRHHRVTSGHARPAEEGYQDKICTLKRQKQANPSETLKIYCQISTMAVQRKLGLHLPRPSVEARIT